MTAAGGKPVPKPGPPKPVQQWFQDRPSPYAWEQEALDHVRRLLPAAEPYRAWATFSFTAHSGRINECDLLVAVPAGLFLIEIKSHPGELHNSRLHLELPRQRPHADHQQPAALQRPQVEGAPEPTALGRPQARDG